MSRPKPQPTKIISQTTFSHARQRASRKTPRPNRTSCAGSSRPQPKRTASGPSGTAHNVPLSRMSHPGFRILVPNIRMKMVCRSAGGTKSLHSLANRMDYILPMRFVVRNAGKFQASPLRRPTFRHRASSTIPSSRTVRCGTSSIREFR